MVGSLVRQIPPLTCCLGRSCLRSSSEPLGATIEAAHLRYRAASNALKEVLTELEEEYRGRGPSGEGGGGEKAGDEQQGGEKEGEAKQGAENEGDAKQGVKKEAADEEGATEAVEEEGLGGGSGEEEAPREGKVEDGEGQSVEMEGESAEGAEREVGAKVWPSSKPYSRAWSGAHSTVEVILYEQKPM